jgi:hypothetical protein
MLQTPVSTGAGWLHSEKLAAQEQQLFPQEEAGALQICTEPMANTSSSTVHRYEDSSSFSKLAEGNTGAITPKLPNPNSLPFQTQYRQ